MTNRKIEYWVIPPEADAEFAANMEEVLETYAKPYDPTCPVICMDEQPVQLFKETRTPIEATAKHPRRVDYEYERAGTAEIFMFTEPLSGWRMTTARQSRTKVDWALEMAKLLDGRYHIMAPHGIEHTIREQFHAVIQKEPSQSIAPDEHRPAPAEGRHE